MDNGGAIASGLRGTAGLRCIFRADCSTLHCPVKPVKFKFNLVLTETIHQNLETTRVIEIHFSEWQIIPFKLNIKKGLGFRVRARVRFRP